MAIKMDGCTGRMDGIESSDKNDKSDKRRHGFQHTRETPKPPQDSPSREASDVLLVLDSGVEVHASGPRFGAFGWGHGALWPLASPSLLLLLLSSAGGWFPAPQFSHFHFARQPKKTPRHSANAGAKCLPGCEGHAPIRLPMCGAPARRGRETAGSPCGYGLWTPTGRQGEQGWVVGGRYLARAPFRCCFVPRQVARAWRLAATSILAHLATAAGARNP